MNILAVGDVVGKEGCECLRRTLPALKKLKGIDFTVVNGENSAPGNGITPDSAGALLDAGADVITTGNHVFRRREVYDYLDDSRFVIRPANYYGANPGVGAAVVDTGRARVAVLNLAGKAYMENGENPFIAVDKLLKEVADCPIILLDFHAEATAEKKAMGFYLDGRVSAVFGTHTHVQTADAAVLPKGTGYITDLGMTGPKYSVLGIKPEISVQWLKTGMPTRFETADGPCMLNACVFEIDEKTGRTLGVESICMEK